ncbi:MAG: hypothetical protein J07HX5_01834 [halophilic archaeon J07HX5]|jgi:hypothetical protein|nr:MAG: hypothetical protein J07HX5_01834 [halophilic archaeon J07HX5]
MEEEAQAVNEGQTGTAIKDPDQIVEGAGSEVSPDGESQN